ncbi:MAG: biotin--[acetyl-CoA-carboxylase] ligase [Eubacteriaceae bacterium]|nr:biotin--[acetyl-CoA-carboxylase] ligase [Eubacteriaceae bacterium]
MPSMKDNILEYFESQPGIVISGGFIAKELHISRTAVWKNIKTLIEEGYDLITVPQRGYYLDKNSDKLSEKLIRKELRTKVIGKDLRIYPTTTSTNDLLKEIAKSGGAEGTVVISEEQTKGKGRMGRSFYSPQGQGIYLSILLRPDKSADKAVSITITSAVAVAEAIDKVAGVDTRIKWINDLFLQEKKICGILTEASMEMESGKLEYVIVGIGINVNKKNFRVPEPLEGVIGYISESGGIDLPISRNRLIAEILNALEAVYFKDDFSSVLKTYKDKSIVLGKFVEASIDGKLQRVKAMDIDEDGRLIIQKESGDIYKLNSGEVSIKHWE